MKRTKQNQIKQYSKNKQATKHQSKHHKQTKPQTNIEQRKTKTSITNNSNTKETKTTTNNKYNNYKNKLQIYKTERENRYTHIERISV